MKITFVLPTLDLSGGCRVLSMYARGLMERGHQIIVVVPRVERRTVREVLKGILKRGILFVRQPTVTTSHFKNSLVDVRIIDRASVISGKAFPEADILVATWWETMEWVERSDKRCGERIYFIQHHEVFDGLPITRVQATYRMNAYKITVSQWIANILATRYDVKNVVVIPNAVDQTLFTSEPRRRATIRRIGFVYSKTGFKGAEVALAAIGVVKATRPDVEVVAFGCEIFHTDFPSYIDLHVEPEQSSIPEIYRSCDVWLCSSHAEGFNLPAMEAMACGTPVVSTRTGWPLEVIIDEVNGYTVDVGDSLALGQRAIDVLRLNEESWAKMSRSAQFTARQQTWQKATTDLERSLKSVIHRAGGAD